MAYAKSILVCLRVCKDRGPVQGLWSQRTLVFQVLPLYPLNLGSAQLLILDLPLFFFGLFLFLALFTFLLTSIYLAYSLTLSDALILESNLWPLPFLVNAEASSVVVGSSVLDSKCWYECTPCTGASTWSTLLDLNTSRD